MKKRSRGVIGPMLIVPFGESAYYGARTSIAIARPGPVHVSFQSRPHTAFVSLLSRCCAKELLLACLP
jgi:hypothetical protein